MDRSKFGIRGDVGANAEGWRGERGGSITTTKTMLVGNTESIVVYVTKIPNRSRGGVH